MNRNIQIRKDKFDLAKKRIHDLANNVPTVEQLPTLETEGGLFGWFDKNVTGAQMNQITRSINNSFIKNNGEIIKLYDQFKEVYNTFDILDKEYIQGILTAVEGADVASQQALSASEEAKEASKEALDAQKDVKRVMEAIRITISKLKEIEELFVENPESFQKIKNIGAIQGELENHRTDISNIFVNLSAISDTIQEAHQVFQKEIDTLQRYSSKLQEFRHLSDIDTIWENVEKHKQEIKELHSSINKLNEDINLSIEKIKNDFQSSFLGINQNISTLERFKSRLEEYQHLKDIDVIWESSKEHHKQLDSLDSQLSQTKVDLTKLDDTITKSFQETHSEIDMKNELLRKRIHIAYWIAGGALFFSLLQFILLIFKVL